MSGLTESMARGKPPASEETQTWGIEPVPVAQRQLGFWDYFVLWLDLGVGLLVIAAGALLAPLGLGPALLATVIGTIIGSAMLAFAGIIGSRTGVPTMPLLRPVLGLRGSYLPSAINVLQLVGWTAFEIWAMGYAANALSSQLLGFSSYLFWAAVFGLLCILLTLGGPMVVVRQWLKKFGVWVVLATSLWITVYLLTKPGLGALLAKPGAGGLPFWVGVDLAIAMPISWMPLVADYNRFAKRDRTAFSGTFLGYVVANIWFYGLGILLILTSAQGTDLGTAAGVATAISGITAGVVALAVILVDETDNAFADLYSAAVSTQNIFPKLNQRWLIVALGAVSIVLAAVLDMGRFQNFLLLMSAVFVPLFGLLIADYFVVRRQVYDVPALYQRGGIYWFANGLNWPAVLAWVFGIVVFNIANPSLVGAFAPGWAAMFSGPAASWVTAIGGSIPGFLASFALYCLLSLVMHRPRDVASATATDDTRETQPS